MTVSTAEVVVVGAGIAGVSSAYHLSEIWGITDIAVVDPRPPLSLTSDKSTECYRNWWPNEPMVSLMNRSIDIFEDLAEEADFGLNRSGYLFVTANPTQVETWRTEVSRVAAMGATAEVLARDALLGGYPFLTEEALGGLFVPRAGWFRAQDLGQWMLDKSRENGARLVSAEVVAIDGSRVTLHNGDEIDAGAIIIASGPLSPTVAAMADVDLPLFSELHIKVAFKDHLGVIPRSAPMTIWSDTQTIGWSDDEREGLTEMGRHDLLGEMPIFCHFRPEGGQDSPYIVALWEYHDQILEPEWPLPEDPLYPEAVMRGLTTMVPGLEAYRDRLPESFVDGGYYTKTQENRPLVGPSGVDGIYLMTGMSGFGVMVSAGAADLVARHVVGAELPDYSDAFLLSRYDDPNYVGSLADAASGQL